VCAHACGIVTSGHASPPQILFHPTALSKLALYVLDLDRKKYEDKKRASGGAKQIQIQHSRWVLGMEDEVPYVCVCAYLCLFHSSLPLISSTYLHPLPSLPPSLPPFLPPSLPTYLPPSLPSLPPSLPTSLPPSIPSPSLPPSLPPSIPPSIPPSFPPSLPRAGRPMVTRCCESCVSSRAGSGTAQDLPALCLRPLRLSYNLRLYLRMSIQSMNLCNVSLSLCLSLSRALSLALSLCLDRLFSGAPFTKKLECVLPSNHSVVCWDRIL
jgi:hypothetical protein